jgi:hypothetical protein
MWSERWGLVVVAVQCAEKAIVSGPLDRGIKVPKSQGWRIITSPVVLLFSYLKELVPQPCLKGG